MSDDTGQTPAAYEPPPVPAAPATPAPAYTPPPAPPVEYAPPAPAPVAVPPKKKKTWLWVLLGIVGLSLVACIALAVFGGGLLVGLFGGLFGADSPDAAIAAINQAALDGDRATYEKHFDADSVVTLAYPAFIEYLKDTTEYADLVEQLGEESAAQVLAEEIMPEATFVEQIGTEFDIDALAEGEVPFPSYTIDSTSVENDTAELTMTTVEDGADVTYVLGMVKETYEGESVWRIKEIKNIADLLGDM